MSYNPVTGLVYVPIKDPTGEVFALYPNFQDTPGKFNTGVARPPGIACPPAPSAVPSKMLPAIGPIRTPPQGQRGANWLIAWIQCSKKNAGATSAAVLMRRDR